MAQVTRRAALAGMGAALCLPSRVRAIGPPSGASGYVLMDVESGAIRDALEPEGRLIPASTVKSITSHLALAALPPAERLLTRIVATGVPSGGVLRGDLHLIGGGDPSLDTADLARLSKALAAHRITRITGDFIFHEHALPYARMIEPRQPWHAAYNPAISGLSLNFNRVQARWDREAGRINVEAMAHSTDRSIVAPSVEIAATTGTNELEHALLQGGERWGIPAGRMKRAGRRWLPVRAPGLYAAQVFRSLCSEAGLVLPEPRAGAALPKDGRLLAQHRSAPVYGLLTQMMKYSTNLTAEMLGLGSVTRLVGPPGSLEQSGSFARDWLIRSQAIQATSETAMLSNHSGLSSASRVSPLELAQVLRAGFVRFGDAYKALHEDGEVSGAARPHELRSKTGTMYFVRGLCGFLKVNGREHVFAIISNEPEKRAALDASFKPFDESRPSGSAGWLGRARAFEADRLEYWTK